MIKIKMSKINQYFLEKGRILFKCLSTVVTVEFGKSTVLQKYQGLSWLTI